MKSTLLLVILSLPVLCQQTEDHSSYSRTQPFRILAREPGTCTPIDFYINGATGLLRECFQQNQWRDAGPGVDAVITSPTASIGQTETAVLSYAITPNAVQVGTTYRLHIGSVLTDASAPAGNAVFQVRIGTTTPPSGTVPASLTLPLNTSLTSLSASLGVDCSVTFATIGSSGTIGGWCVGYGAGGGYSNITTTNVAVDTTVAETLQLTAQMSASGPTAVVYWGRIFLDKP
jgi:hypothetical protein